MLNLITGLCVFAQTQIPDNIIYNGKSYDLQSSPMDNYFKSHPDKRPRRQVYSQNLLRGYITSFEVRDSQLYISDIQLQVPDTSGEANHHTNWKHLKTKLKSVFAEVFPGQKEFAEDWTNGLMELTFGDTVSYSDKGFTASHENYIILEIDKGKLKQSKQFGYKDFVTFKQKQFKAFTDTDEYFRTRITLKKRGLAAGMIDAIIKDAIIGYSSRILTDQ